LFTIVGCVVCVEWLIRVNARPSPPGEVPSLTNAGFPATFISRIHLDLSSPNQYVTLTWTGRDAARQESGPFCSSPGAGWGTNDCNDSIESNCQHSLCTPKGLRKVEGFSDRMKDGHGYRYVTWIDKGRAIAFHSYPLVASYPASQGCVRLEPHVARLIYDNAIEGVTEILIDGTWTNPKTTKQKEPRTDNLNVNTKASTLVQLSDGEP
jgi:hypothetical protein